MLNDFIDNCKTILRQAWDLFFGGGRQFVNLDSIYNRRDKFTAFVLPMGAMAALLRLLSIFVFQHNAQAAIVGMIFCFVSFLAIYLVMGWLAERLVRAMSNVELPEGRGRVFTLQLMMLHFDIGLLLDLLPSFGLFQVLYVYTFYIAWKLADSYLGIHENRRAWFMVITAVAFYGLFQLIDIVLNLMLPNSPL